MQASDVLSEQPAPGDPHREEHGVEALHDRAALLHAHAPAQEERIPREPVEPCGKTLGVVPAR